MEIYPCAVEDGNISLGCRRWKYFLRPSKTERFRHAWEMEIFQRTIEDGRISAWLGDGSISAGPVLGGMLAGLTRGSIMAHPVRRGMLVDLIRESIPASNVGVPRQA